MGIAADIAGDWHASLAALAWQVEAGVDEVIGDAPVNRYELAAEAPKLPTAPVQPVMDPATSIVAAPADAAPAGAISAARRAAVQAGTLEDLRAAILAFDGCELKRGARNTLFAEGNPSARVLVLGEVPDPEEDREGRPFTGRAGALLDRMFAAIGLSRTSPDPGASLYLLPVLPWRPPVGRDPEAAELAMMQPFLERHIALADPEIIVALGNTPLLALTGTRGIARARGAWVTALGKPVLPMVHPAQLLANPAAKREAWADLLALQARLNG
jgi:uracil-DNA glycosylase